MRCHTTSVKCFLWERIFNNVKVNVDSETNMTEAGLNLHSLLSLSIFTDVFTIIVALLDFPMRYNLSILVILLNATFICP